MPALSILDLIIGIIVLFFLITGYKKGFVRQTATILGLLISVYISIYFYLDFVIFLERFLDLSPTILQFISFAVIFIVFNVIIHLLGEALKSLLDSLYLESADRAAGILFGALKGVALVYLMVVILDQIPLPEIESIIENSYLAVWLLDLTPLIQEALGGIIRRP